MPDLAGIFTAIWPLCPPICPEAERAPKSTRFWSTAAFPVILSIKLPGSACLKDAASTPACSRWKNFSRAARHPSELAAYAALLAANWEPPDTCVTQAYAGAEAALLTPRCPLRFVVGYADGEAVCGAEFRLGPGTLAGVYGLVTPARHRRQGFASRLLWAALVDLRAAGFTHATLQASEDGLHLYRRMGFQPYGDWVEYCGRLLPAKG